MVDQITLRQFLQLAYLRPLEKTSLIKVLDALQSDPCAKKALRTPQLVAALDAKRLAGWELPDVLVKGPTILCNSGVDGADPRVGGEADRVCDDYSALLKASGREALRARLADVLPPLEPRRYELT